MDTAALYAGTRARITDLVRGLSPGQHEAIAPAAPEWRVRDIVAHLSGVVGDILSGNLDGVATDAWTGAQVEARRDKTVDEVLKEWNETAPTLDGMINNFGETGVQIVMDTVTHEHDVRGAVNQPGARDDEAVDAALQWLVGAFDGRLQGSGFPALRLVAGSQEWVIGEGDVGATVTAPSEFDALRALIGRRSPTQVAQWKWDGEAGPYLGLISPWGLRPTDLVE